MAKDQETTNFRQVLRLAYLEERLAREHPLVCGMLSRLQN